MELLGKNALVTGASRGIGRAIATGLAREGANVVINYYNSEAAAEEVKKDIEKSGRTAIIVKADVSKEEDVEKMTKVSQDAFHRIDILVNCSGIYPHSFVVDTSEEIWDRTIATNLKGTFLCCRSMIRSMIEQKSGKIVNITSGRGVAGAMGGAAYSASKAGIIGFTKSLAMEVAPYKINVNAVAPGQIDTEMSRGGKSDEEIKGIEEKLVNPYLPNGIGKPDDVVGTVIFLSSEACRFITGQVIFMRGP